MPMSYRDRTSLYQSSRFKFQSSGGSFNLFVHVGTLEPLSVENSEKEVSFFEPRYDKKKNRRSRRDGLDLGDIRAQAV